MTFDVAFWQLAAWNLVAFVVAGAGTLLMDIDPAMLIVG
jgi:hypothetical protein